MDVLPLTQAPVAPTSGMALRESVQLEPGVYYLPEGLTIEADGVTLDGNGATLIGDSRTGAAVHVNGFDNITIKNLKIRDFKHGVAVHNARRLTICGCHIASTAEIAPNTIFLDIWRPATDPYGGAILLDRVADSLVHDNDIQHQMNGLMAYHCTNLTVRHNVASFNSGFGFYLYNTCDSLFDENWADFCCRYQPRNTEGPKAGVGAYGHMGADAAGFVIVTQSCRNIFRRNSARLGGDGFFVAGRNPDGEDVSCDNNLFEYNDASLSPNIGFESTFSRGNIFRHNWADRCNYGFWLGYSTDNVLEHNRMLYNRQAGIAVEHGVGFQVRENDFQYNGAGVLLWTKFVQAFYEDPKNHHTVRDWTIEKNRFYKNFFGVAIRADRDHGIRPVPPEEAGKPDMRPCDIALRGNDIQDNRVGIHLAGTDRITIEQNKLNLNVEADLRREDDRDTRLGHNLGLRGAYL